MSGHAVHVGWPLPKLRPFARPGNTREARNDEPPTECIASTLLIPVSLRPNVPRDLRRYHPAGPQSMPRLLFSRVGQYRLSCCAIFDALPLPLVSLSVRVEVRCETLLILNCAGRFLFLAATSPPESSSRVRQAADRCMSTATDIGANELDFVLSLSSYRFGDGNHCRIGGFWKRLPNYGKHTFDLWPPQCRFGRAAVGSRGYS
jgi:hypothetical protein